MPFVLCTFVSHQIPHCIQCIHWISIQRIKHMVIIFLKIITQITPYSSDAILMATPGTEPDTSIVLAHSTSNFAFNPQLIEYTTHQRIRGNVWEIVHMRPRNQRDAMLKKQLGKSSDESPLCIEQHLCPLEKFYVITSKVLPTRQLDYHNHVYIINNYTKLYLL